MTIDRAQLKEVSQQPIEAPAPLHRCTLIRYWYQPYSAHVVEIRGEAAFMGPPTAPGALAQVTKVEASRFMVDATNDMDPATSLIVRGLMWNVLDDIQTQLGKLKTGRDVGPNQRGKP